MGRLQKLQEETALYQDKQTLYVTKRVFTVKDVVEEPSKFDDKGQWVVSIIFQDTGFESKICLSKGGRDGYMEAIQKSISEEGWVSDCIMNMRGKYYFIDEVDLIDLPE